MNWGIWFSTCDTAFAETFADIFLYTVEEPVAVPVVIESEEPVALAEVVVVPVSASSCIVIVISVFAIVNNWFLTGIKSFVAGWIVKSKVDPEKESGLKEVNVIWPLLYATVPILFATISLSFRRIVFLFSAI